MINDNGEAVMTEIDEIQFESEVLKSNRPAMVMFWAPWSAPCKILTPVMDRVAMACGGNVKVFKINADDHPSLSLWYGVQSIPTVLYFVRGTLRGQMVGTASKEAILSLLRRNSNAERDQFAARKDQ